MERKNKNSKIKFVNSNIKSGNYRVNPKLIRKEIIQPKILKSQNRLKIIDSKAYDWRNNTNSYLKNSNHRFDMDAKINYKKKREGD